MKKDRLNIGVINFPISEAGNIPLSNLIEILLAFSSDICLITGNAGYTFFKDNKKIHTVGVKHKTGANSVTRIINFICTQLKISYKVLHTNNKVSFWVFFLAGPTLLLPMLTAKLFRKKVVLAFAGSDIESVKAESAILSKPIEFLVKINLTLCNRIILYSENLIKEWRLEKYRNKIYIAHEHFLDFNKFKIKNKSNDRKNLVGYIGRLDEEKGVLNFVKAIPRILKKEGGIKFLVVGDGKLRSEIEKYLEEKNLQDKVELAGWINHDELPDYLNRLKLLVLPSHTEGLPNLMLESMACGTPVLATSVGTIPDMIKDEGTGFIMEDNSPTNIAKNVMRALECSNLEQIAKNAQALIEKEFTYKKAVEGYKKAIQINNKKFAN